MRQFCVCAIVVLTAGLCGGGAGDCRTGLENVAVTCIREKGDRNIIELWCNMETLFCSSTEGRDESSIERSSIRGSCRDLVFRTIRGSDHVTYSCQTGEAGDPESATDPEFSSWPAAPLETTNQNMTSNGEQSRSRKPRESHHATKERAVPGYPTQPADLQKKGHKRRKRQKRHSNTSPAGSRGNNCDEEDGNTSNNGCNDWQDAEECCDENNARERPGDTDTGNPNRRTPGHPPDSGKDVTTESPQTDAAGTRVKDVTSESPDTTPEAGSWRSLAILIPSLLGVLLLLAAGTVFLWKKKQNTKGDHQIGGASAQQEDPKKKLVTIYVTANASGNAGLPPTNNTTDHIYQEIPDPPTESAEIMKNPLYVPVESPPPEQQAGTQAPPPADGGYCLLTLPAQR